MNRRWAPLNRHLGRAWHNDWFRTVSIAMALAGISLALSLGGVGPVRRLGNLWFDAIVSARASQQRPAPADTVVVDVDDVSLSAVGQWPWPRYRIGALIERVAAAQPRAIALDIIFPEPDRTSLASLERTFRDDFGVDLKFSGVPEGLRDNDGFLASVMGRSQVVAAHYLYFDHTSSQSQLRTGLRITGATDALDLPAATGLLTNAGALATQAQTSGFMNSGADPDGVVRRVPLLLRYAGTVHPSLALAATMRALGVDTATVQRHAVFGASLRIGERRVPIADDGTLLLRFDGAGKHYRGVPALDVFNGNLRDADLAGKLVFIGSSAVGTNDLHLTSVDARFPGLKIQSVAAENLLHGTAIAEPAWARWMQIVLCCATALAMSWAFVRRRGVLPMLAVTAFAVAGTLGMSAMLMVQGVWFSPVAPMLVAVMLFATLFTHSFIAERRRADQARRQLENARQVTIESMAAVAETRDPETGAHIKRTQHYVRAIANRMRQTGLHPGLLTPDYIQLLFLSAPLHDIGKVGVPDRILLKPGRLNDAEMELMMEHAEYGRKIVLSTAQHIDGDNFLAVASDIAGTHHEKWDGTGYPRGLAGQNIPLAGRIMAVADVYDALISRRCYKEPFTHSHSTALMRDMRGRSFDPDVLDAFFAIEKQIVEIANHFQDEAEQASHSPVTSRAVIPEKRAQQRVADESIA